MVVVKNKGLALFLRNNLRLIAIYNFLSIAAVFFLFNGLFLEAVDVNKLISTFSAYIYPLQYSSVLLNLALCSNVWFGWVAMFLVCANFMSSILLAKLYGRFGSAGVGAFFVGASIVFMLIINISSVCDAIGIV